MEKKLIFAGFGGQGVLTLGQIISLIQMKKGLNVSWFPSYGAEMRGGTANCSVIYSDEPIGSPVVKKNIDILVALNEPSLRKFENAVKSGGIILIDTSTYKNAVTERKDVIVKSIDATELASEIGNLKVLNVVVLGAFAKITGDFTKEEAFETLKEKLKGKEKLFEMNEKAIKIGYEKVS
ncbi:2-oxoacid:acceptor oxidoreductase family protein [Fusobacterium sp. PH5-44]|uniref:2-oxoacid:acceptor oxidoreductase family protein n=1 Tax=unclassified Fusobacterium TaxID=2648384 RepID=UPI003D24536F